LANPVKKGGGGVFVDRTVTVNLFGRKKSEAMASAVKRGDQKQGRTGGGGGGAPPPQKGRRDGGDSVHI